MTGLGATSVALVALWPGDVGWLSAMLCDRDAVGLHNWPGEPVDRDAVERSVRASLAGASPLTGRLLVVVDDGVRAGFVSWRPVAWGPTPGSVSASIGIALRPEFRARGIGRRAQELLIDRLFRETTVERVQADTAVDHTAERRALESLGLTQEGVIRRAELRDGVFHDHALYSVLRDEWAGRVGRSEFAARGDGLR